MKGAAANPGNGSRSPPKKGFNWFGKFGYGGPGSQKRKNYPRPRPGAGKKRKTTRFSSPRGRKWPKTPFPRGERDPLGRGAFSIPQSPTEAKQRRPKGVPSGGSGGNPFLLPKKGKTDESGRNGQKRGGGKGPGKRIGPGLGLLGPKIFWGFGSGEKEKRSKGSGGIPPSFLFGEKGDPGLGWRPWKET